MYLSIEEDDDYFLEEPRLLDTSFKKYTRDLFLINNLFCHIHSFYFYCVLQYFLLAQLYYKGETIKVFIFTFIFYASN